jgi:hypothetical protein
VSLCTLDIVLQCAFSYKSDVQRTGYSGAMHVYLDKFLLSFMNFCTNAFSPNDASVFLRNFIIILDCSSNSNFSVLMIISFLYCLRSRNEYITTVLSMSEMIMERAL